MSVYGNIITENDINFVNWLSEDVEVTLEGANIDMLKEFVSMKKEYKAEIKVFRQAIKDNDKKAAEKSKDNLSKIVNQFKDYCKKNRKDIENSGLVGTVIDLSKLFIAAFLFTFCSKKALEYYAKNKNASIEWDKQKLLDKILGLRSFRIKTDKNDTIGARNKAAIDISEFNNLLNTITKIFNFGIFVKSFSDGTKMNQYNTSNSLYVKLMQITEKLEKEISNLKLDFMD